jgi:DUF4097 and DUF4098 domain-containing protein YvlB
MVFEYGEDFMQGKSYVIGVGVLILALVGVYGVGVWHVHQVSKLYTGPAMPFDETRTVSGSGLQTIHVSVDDAHVQLHPVDSSVVTVHASGSVDTSSPKNITFRADGKSGTLDVVLEQNNAAKRGKENLVLDIGVPKAEYGSIQVLSGSGNVNVEKLTSTTMDIETSGSAVSVANLATNLTVNDGGGTILADDVSGKLDLQTGQGNAIIHESSFSHDVNVTVDAGSIAIDVKTPPVNVRYQLTSQIGNLVAKLPGQKFVRSEPGNVMGYVGSGGPIIQASSNDGNITLDVAK